MLPSKIVYGKRFIHVAKHRVVPHIWIKPRCTYCVLGQVTWDWLYVFVPHSGRL